MSPQKHFQRDIWKKIDGKIKVEKVLKKGNFKYYHMNEACEMLYLWLSHESWIFTCREHGLHIRLS